MKKIFALILSALLFAALAVGASATVVTPDEGYTIWPLLCNENVKFIAFDADGNEDEIEVPDPLEITNGMVVGDNGELQLWFPLGANHLSEFKLLEKFSAMLSQGVAHLDNMYTEITFKGTAIKLGTCYRNIAAELGTSNAAKVTIDGTEYPCIEGALVPEQANDTTVTIFFEASGLEDKEHTVRVYNAEKNFNGTRLNFDFYEIIGTDPVTEGGYGKTEESTEPPATEPKNTENPNDGTTSGKKDEPVSSAAGTEKPGTEKPADDNKDGFPIWIPIVAVVVVAAVVVVVVLAKKKKK